MERREKRKREKIKLVNITDFFFILAVHCFGISIFQLNGFLDSFPT